MMLAAWSALHSLDSGPKVLSGTVSVVNAQSTKFCLTPDGEDEWCGRLAMSGGTPVKVGQKVAVIVTSLDTEPDGAMQIATLVPPELSLK